MTALAGATGAQLHVDSASIEHGPPSPPGPTPTASPTASGTPTPTPTPTWAPWPTVFDTLVDGDFEAFEALFGWRPRGGDALVGSGLGDPSQAAVLLSQTTATKWLY